MAVNLAHGQLRRRLVTPDKMILVEETIGKQGADRFLDSGITGVTPGKVRVFLSRHGAIDRTFRIAAFPNHVQFRCWWHGLLCILS